MPGHRRSLMTDPLHQAAITADHISVVVNQIRTKLGRKDTFSQSHTESRRYSLTQGTSGGFNSVRLIYLRVARRNRLPLTKIF